MSSRRVNRVLHVLKGTFNSTFRHITPTDLFFFVTDRCNERCEHCFFRYAIDNGDSIDDLDLDKIERISRSLREPLHSLVLTGGEPFLRSDLAEICALFRAINRVETIFLLTNGLLTERIVDQVERICARDDAHVCVQVSLDGLPETHDEIRGTKGAFQRAVATVKALRRLQERYKRLTVTVSTTISQRNVGELEALADWVLDNLSVSHSFDVVRGTRFRESTMLGPTIASPAHPVDVSSQPLSLTVLESLYPRMERIYRRNTRLVTQGHLLWTPIAYAYRIRRFWHLIDVVGKRRPFRCPAGDSMGVIYPSGAVALCELTKPVGSLADWDYDFHAVWTSGEAQAMRAHIRRCFCSHGCFQTVAMMREPQMYGRMLQSAISYVMR